MILILRIILKTAKEDTKEALQKGWQVDPGNVPLLRPESLVTTEIIHFEEEEERGASVYTPGLKLRREKGKQGGGGGEWGEWARQAEVFLEDKSKRG